MLGLVMPKVSWMNSGGKLSPVASAHLDPGVLVQLERVDEDAVVVEDGEIGVGWRGQGRSSSMSGGMGDSGFESPDRNQR